MLVRMDTIVRSFDIDTSIGVPYSPNDQIGQLVEIKHAISDSTTASILNSLTIIDIDKQKSPLDVLFFSENVTITSSDNSTVNISSSELKNKFLGLVKVIASDYSDLLNSSVACKINIGLVLQGTKVLPTERNTSLYALLVSRGNPSFTTASSIKLKMGLRKS